MNTLGFFALALAVGGLIAVVVEIVLKNPGAILELAQDAGRFAREPVAAPHLGTVAASAARKSPTPANDGGRAAA
jgi:hypothetical protein